MQQILFNKYSLFIIGLCVLSPVWMQAQSAKKPPTDSLSFLLTKAPDSTFGYFIFKQGDLMIEQTSIPGLQGLKGFSRREDAEKTAALVIKKIRNREFPPSITIDELKILGIPEALEIKE